MFAYLLLLNSRALYDAFIYLKYIKSKFIINKKLIEHTHTHKEVSLENVFLFTYLLLLLFLTKSQFPSMKPPGNPLTLSYK